MYYERPGGLAKARLGLGDGVLRRAARTWRSECASD